MERSFRTKTGFCHITDDQIILSREGINGGIAKAAVGNSITRILAIYGVIAALLLYYSYKQYQEDNLTTAVVFCIVSAYLIFGILRSLNNSATPIIDRKQIKQVRFVKGVSGFTRSRFEVVFNESGKQRKRLIMLPGSLSNGKIEEEKAVNIMRAERLIT